MTFEVQTLTICDGWINIWHETGDDDITRPPIACHPMTFAPQNPFQVAHLSIDIIPRIT